MVRTPETAPQKNPGDEDVPGGRQTGEEPCPRCGGTGVVAGDTCPDCAGTGRVTVIVGDA